MLGACTDAKQTTPRYTSARAPTSKGEQVSDLLDRIRKELTTRVNELRPLHEEHARLEMALRALNEAGTSGSRAANSPQGNGRRRAGQKKTPAKPHSANSRKRTPRGANREAVLRALHDRPGVSSAELAAVSGVERNTLYALLTRLVIEGELEKQALPSGRNGYALTTRPSEFTDPATSTEAEAESSAPPSDSATQ